MIKKNYIKRNISIFRNTADNACPWKQLLFDKVESQSFYINASL